DNIADAQALSATLLESYLNAAAEVAKLAVGDKNSPKLVQVYRVSPFTSEHPWDHIDGAPYGTRGGIVALNNFPADGIYAIRLYIEGGVGTRLEDIDISLDGSNIASLHYEKGIDRTLAPGDAELGADYIKAEPMLIKAGQHRIAAAWVRRAEG